MKALGELKSPTAYGERAWSVPNPGATTAWGCRGPGEAVRATSKEQQHREAAQGELAPCRKGLSRSWKHREQNRRFRGHLNHSEREQMPWLILLPASGPPSSDSHQLNQRAVSCPESPRKAVFSSLPLTAQNRAGKAENECESKLLMTSTNSPCC